MSSQSPSEHEANLLRDGWIKGRDIAGNTIWHAPSANDQFEKRAAGYLNRGIVVPGVLTSQPPQDNRDLDVLVKRFGALAESLGAQVGNTRNIADRIFGESTEKTDGTPKSPAPPGIIGQLSQEAELIAELLERLALQICRLERL